MFRRFARIKDSGIFEDYCWDSSLPELARINVVFGGNGTGKTSLAGALYGLRNSPDGDGFTRVSIAVGDTSDACRVTGHGDDAIFDRVHVFSEEYVGRSHTFTPDAAEVKAVLTIGEKSIDETEKLKDLRELFDARAQKQDTAKKDGVAAKGALDNLYRQVSQNVVDAASNAGGRWRSKNKFNVDVVRNAFEDSHATWMELSEKEIGNRAGVISSAKADVLPETSLVFTPPADIAARLSAALAATPTTLILDTLDSHPEATSWVDAGRHLHDEIDVCIFCGSELSAERRALIDRHFSGEVETLKATLAGIADELTRIETGVDEAFAAIPDRGSFFEDLRGRYDSASGTLRAELAALKHWAIKKRGRVEEKAASVLDVVESAVDNPPAVGGGELLHLRQEHNNRVEHHDELVKNAADAVERHYLKQAEDKVTEQTDLVAAKQTEVEELDRELSKYRDEITNLENVEGDPLPSARVLTEEVARLLGRMELKFEAVDSKRYRVLRHEEPAGGLSVGERTAITLVHFLESVARFDASNGKAIVVIDDPVSSLDSDIFMGVSTYIWKEAVVKRHVGQLILLTHNFELFRQWDIQIEGLQRGGKDKETGQPLTELFSAEFYEIQCRHFTSNGQTRRRPVIVSWPPSDAVRKKVRSTYHHAFLSIATALQELQDNDSLEHRLDAQLLFPNVVRRVLESFLAFKRPEWVGDFSGAMRNSTELLKEGGYSGDPDALRLRLTRYFHAYSHQEDPSTDTTVPPGEVGTAMRAAFEFMHQIDRGHFRGLCNTVEVDPDDLLREPPTEVASV